MRHPWPGNLRELRNAMERAAILSSGPRIEAEDLPRPLRPDPALTATTRSASESAASTAWIKSNRPTSPRSSTGHPPCTTPRKILGIDKATLYRKRKRLGMD